MKARCPICSKTTDSRVHPDFPFCSERHRLIDLGRWADERYRISESRLSDMELPRRTATESHDEPEHDS